ncbi:MAG: protoporphyrinogen oxidase HemJ [Hyphomicrobiales bacterium]
MADFYLWAKAVHVIAVVAWMVGLFYLPRLFVYHAASAPSGEVSEQFKIMERRLAEAIMVPAAVTSWLAGLLTAWLGGILWPMPLWLAVKLTTVLVLSIFHGMLERNRRQFARDLRPHGALYFRIVNEVPTLLLVVIVVMVIVRPF